MLLLPRLLPHKKSIKMTLELLYIHPDTGDNIQHDTSYFLGQIKHESHVLRAKGF